MHREAYHTLTNDNFENQINLHLRKGACPLKGTCNIMINKGKIISKINCVTGSDLKIVGI